MTTTTIEPTSIVTYLRKELGFTIKEWQELSDEQKKELKEAGSNKMKAQGIPIK